MLDRILHKLRAEKLSDTSQLIREAAQFPRYKDHIFSFRNYTLRVTDFISVAYQLLEYFEDQRLKFDSSKTEPFIIDCGSNVGVSILYFKSIFPKARILAFEPDPKVFACLEENLRKNNVTNVTAEKKAVWINDKGIEFGSEGADGGSVHFSGNKITVPTVSLKNILQNENSVDLLKIDIEGAELDVLLDCADELKKVNHLFVEYHSWVKNPQELDKLLSIMQSNGFRYYIHSIGNHAKQPFIKNDSPNGMDIQLDIYAVNERVKDQGI